MPSSIDLKGPEVARARAYPPGNDFWAWWEVCKMHAHDHADMDQLARDAALRATEKVKEAESGPAGRRVFIIEAQWWFCQEVSLSLDKPDARMFRFKNVVSMPAPHRRKRQYANLYRLETAAGFEHADDVAAVFAAGWDVAALGAEPRDVIAVVRAAADDADGKVVGALTRREVRGVLQNLVLPGVAVAVKELSSDVSRGCQLPNRHSREKDIVTNLLRIRGVILDESSLLIDAAPAPFRPNQGSEDQPSKSWETWND